MIVVNLRDLPPGLTAREAAALVYGPARAATDLIITIRPADLPAAPPARRAPLSQPADIQSAAEELFR
jgi:hypothetical protein